MSDTSDEEEHTKSFKDGGKVSKDEEMFSLLFSRCDKENSGWAVVDDLVEFIRNMLSVNSHTVKKNEDMYDSDESTHEANYNLDLLKCMLDTHAVDGEINSVSYEYVVSKWVRDLRSRSASPNSSKSSQDSNDRESVDGNNSHNYSGNTSSLLQDSFETSGGAGGYSNHDMDPVQMMNSMAELQIEAKRLKERNDQLLLQMESSEENMRQLQNDNKDLNAKIKSQHQGLVQLDAVKEDNAELAKRLIEGEKICIELKEKIESVQQELQDLQGEISHLQNQLTASTNEREDLIAQTQALQNILSQKDEEIKIMEQDKINLESCLEDQQLVTESLNGRLTTTHEAVEELKLENSSLQQQINDKERLLPVSSTPFRSTAPSLQEELANSDIANGMSPMGLMNTSMDELLESISNQEDEDGGFFDKLASSKAKFEEKAKLMQAGLSELIDTPLTTVGGSERNRTSEGITTTDDFRDVIESSLRKVETKKKRETKRNQKLSEELKRAQEENEELRNRLNDLERQQQNEQSGSTDSGNVDSSTSSKLLLSHQSTQTVCNRTEDKFIGNEITSVTTQASATCIGTDNAVINVKNNSSSSPETSARSRSDIDSAYSSVVRTEEITGSDNKRTYPGTDSVTLLPSSSLISVPINEEFLEEPLQLNEGPLMKLDNEGFNKKSVEVNEEECILEQTVPVTKDIDRTNSNTSTMTLTTESAVSTNSIPMEDPILVGESSKTLELIPTNESSPLTETTTTGESSTIAPVLISTNDNDSSQIKQSTSVPIKTPAVPKEALISQTMSTPVTTTEHANTREVVPLIESQNINSIPVNQSGNEPNSVSIESSLPTKATHSDESVSTKGLFTREDSVPIEGSKPTLDDKSDTIRAFESNDLVSDIDSMESVPMDSSLQANNQPILRESVPMMGSSSSMADTPKKIVLSRTAILNDEVVSDSDSQYQSLHDEIARLKEQLQTATDNAHTGDIAIEQRDILHESTFPQFGTRQQSQGAAHTEDIAVEQGLEESTLPSIIEPTLKRRLPQLEITPVIITALPPSSSQKSCLPVLGNLFLATIRASVWISLFLLLVFLLLIVLIGVNSSISRCGGRHCTDSFIHMLFGQNLIYTHSGDIPI